MAESDAEMKAKRQALADQENAQPERDDGPSDILATGDDEDVIF